MLTSGDHTADGGGDRRVLRWARVAMIVGALLLSAAVGLFVWEALSADPDPVVITGRP